MDIASLNNTDVYYTSNNNNIKLTVVIDNYMPYNNVKYSDFDLSFYTKCDDVVTLNSIGRTINSTLKDPKNYKSQDGLGEFLVKLLTDPYIIVHQNYCYSLDAKAERFITYRFITYKDGVKLNIFTVHLSSAIRLPGCETAYESAWEKNWQHTPFLKGDLNRTICYKYNTTGRIVNMKLMGLCFNSLSALFYVLKVEGNDIAATAYEVNGAPMDIEQIL